AFNGAEPVRAGTLDRFAAAFAPCGFRRTAFHPCYGLAEATLLVSGARALEGGRQAAVAGGRPVVSCGRVSPEQEVLAVEPVSGVQVPAGQVGEIWVAGASVAQGY